MTQDDIERNIKFIVEQQAQFVTDLHQVREVLHTHSEAITAIIGMVGRIAEAQLRTETNLAEFQRRTETRFAELAEAQRETHERLNAFIVVVEKFISRNGGAKEN